MHRAVPLIPVLATSVVVRERVWCVTAPLPVCGMVMVDTCYYHPAPASTRPLKPLQGLAYGSKSLHLRPGIQINDAIYSLCLVDGCVGIGTYYTADMCR